MTTQHRLIVLDISIRNNKTINIFGRVQKTGWWNLKGESYDLFEDGMFCKKFAINEWNEMSNIIRRLAKEIFKNKKRVSFASQRKVDAGVRRYRKQLRRNKHILKHDRKIKMKKIFGI